jgi:hypothetical protein
LFFFKALARAATAVENNIHVVATGKIGMFCQEKKRIKCCHDVLSGKIYVLSGYK